MGVFNRRSSAQPQPQLRAIQGSATPVPQTPSLSRSAVSGTGAARSLPFSTHRALTAAAQIVDITTSEQRSSYTKRRSTSQGWQDEAWLYADAIGEINYAFSYVANAVSRVKLYAGEITDPTAPPQPVDQDSQIGQASQDILDRLSSAFGGVPGLLRDLTLNLEIVGEALLVQRPANPFASPPQLESWDIRSVDEVIPMQDGRWAIIDREGGDKNSAVILPKNAYVARIWRPHPRYSGDAHSSMRPVLDLCAEALLLNKTFRSTERSRLNSGLLYLPDGLSVAAQGDPDAFAGSEDELEDTSEESAFPTTSFDSSEGSDTDEFEEALLEAMMTPIADEESASAVVPLIVRGPADLGEKIKLIQFERTFDPTLKERAETVLTRILQGLDIPKEIVQGLQSLKFSASQMVDTQLSANHVEPMALVIADALTTVYLRPALRSLGFTEDEVRKQVIWFDAFDVTRRPNRAEDADKGYQNHLISGAAWRKAHQFTDDDAPTSTEVAFRMLLDKGAITPELAESLLTVVAPDIMQAVRDASQAANPETAVPPAVEDVLGGTPATETSAPTDSSEVSPDEITPAPDNLPSEGENI